MKGRKNNTLDTILFKLYKKDSEKLRIFFSSIFFALVNFQWRPFSDQVSCLRIPSGGRDDNYRQNGFFRTNISLGKSLYENCEIWFGKMSRENRFCFELDMCRHV